MTVTSFKITMGENFAIMMVLALFLHVTSSHAQANPGGFISIDCGSAVPQFIDSRTSLTWVDDERYIRTGKNGAVPSEVNSSLDNSEALRSFRYFPERRNKYCYELQMENSNISFLIRIMFLHGKSPELGLPVTFDVSINGTRWATVQYAVGDDLMIPQVREGIFYIPAGGSDSLNTTYVCLVPKRGVPFISSLELRQFDSEGIMYSESFDKQTRQRLYFSTLMRRNPGAAASAPTVRYPDDAYDRFWISNYPGARGIDSLLNASAKDTRASPSQNIRTSSKVNNVPYQVMMDAWTFCCNYPYSFHFRLPFTEAGDLVYGIFYFNILNSTILSNSSGEVPISITVDSMESSSFDITNQTTTKTFFRVLSATYSGITVNSPYLSINAFEFYKQGSFASASTNPTNVHIVNFLKELLNKTDWQGDPCTPVSDDWFTCRLNNNDGMWYLDTLKLSHIDLSNASTLSNLWRKSVNDDGYAALSVLSITDSLVDDKTFRFLLANLTTGSILQLLDLSNNNISLFPNSTTWATDVGGSAHVFDRIHSLNLSHNHLRDVPHLIDFPFSNQLQILNLSYNNMRGNFPNSSYFSNLTALQTLDISNNYINGPIPDSLGFSNLPSLKVLDISSNFFTGEFPASFFFSEREVTESFRTINVEHNAITGMLNLTTWYQKLQSASMNLTNLNNTKFGQIFSFVDNDISDIIPSASDFQPIISLLIKAPHFSESGILLGGNPYCRGAKSFTKRYICRSSVNEIAYAIEEKKINTRALISGTILGGSFSIVCIGILLLIIWRLWGKISALRVIQQELANRNVQPPFYSYRELKLATRNFHQSNKLGKGSFGVVYKGILVDGTIVAVKRLLHSREKQVLHEFLNEVVLITGIKHKNLIQLKGCCIKDQERILVYEYAQKGNLGEALWGNDDGEVLDWEKRLNICAGMARGLSYLHEELQPRIIHRDIKPANILLDKNLNSKIADFGLAMECLDEDNEAHFTNFAGTKGYFAPEYALEGQLTTKADVFSFGILVLEIVTGRRCTDRKQPHDQFYLKHWAEKLQKNEQLLDLVQPSLRSEYPEAEVLEVMNIALMCVRDHPQHRPMMIQVGTMLLDIMGNNFPIPTARAHGREEEHFDEVDAVALRHRRIARYKNLTMVEESEESRMIHTQSGPLVWSNESICDSAGRDTFATI